MLTTADLVCARHATESGRPRGPRIERDAAAPRAGPSKMSTGERIYRVRRTILQMLRDRGYLVDQADVDQSEEDFFEKFSTSPQRDMLTLLVQKRDDPSDQVFVFWPVDPKVGVKPIKRYMERMNEEDVKRAILVVQQNLTAFARQALSEIQASEGADPRAVPGERTARQHHGARARAATYGAHPRGEAKPAEDDGRTQTHTNEHARFRPPPLS